MLQGIESKSALNARRRIAQSHSRIAVRQFVEHHGHDEDDYGKDEGDWIHELCYMMIAAAHEGNLSRRVSEEGAEKVYRSEKAAVIFFYLFFNI